MTRERVIVAMSGGVDSSVAAKRLIDQGFEVVGVTLHLWDYPDNGQKGRCCAPEDQYDARRVADRLGFPHYSFDRRDLFKETVVDPFVSGYLEGVTPSPCVACNRSVKMRELLQIADRLGAKRVATGHYARVLEQNGRFELHQACDRDKDQSYFLHMLEEHELARLLLPLGDLTKPLVRTEARDAELAGADKGESQELCFVPQGRYAEFVEQRADGRVRPGKVLSPEGHVVAEHTGMHRFTIGQRKGLGVALGKPVFVREIDGETAEVKLGFDDEIGVTEAWLAADLCFRKDVVFPREARVKVRARHAGAEAQLFEESVRGARQLRVVFREPTRAVAPGQVAVAYDGDRVLGGGVIARGVVAGGVVTGGARTDQRLDDPC